MNTLKTIQTSFLPYKNSFGSGTLPKRKNFFLSLSKSSDAGSESEPSPAEGDKRKQELLVKIAMLQTQKVRLTDYLDERAAYLTEFAEKANDEFDEIGENALKELDEAGTRIMEKLENKMQAFEENAESNRLEIEMNEKKVVDFEGQIRKDKNEGLFFKNLGDKPAPEDEAKIKEEAKMEAEKLKELTRKSAGSSIRRNVYLALIGLLVVGLADALFFNPSDWLKVGAVALILVALLTQFIYEQNMSSKKGKTD